jgi:hypothetical protein
VVLATTLPLALREPANTLGLLAFALWALAPYALLLIAGRFVANPWTIGGAGAAAVVFECAIRASVLLFPRGSTAAIALVFSPAYIAIVVMPIGAAAGLVSGWLWQRNIVALRAGVVLMSAVVLGLLAVGVARPDLFPTTVARRRATVQRIGPPRVVAGADAFELETVSTESAWYDAGPLDGESDDVIVVTSAGHVRLLDPDDMHERKRFDLDPGGARAWNWYSKLAHIGDRFVVVQTGGGFSETKLLEVDGRVAWQYRPDPSLPPTSLRPADLDRDGRVELYAAGQAITRLDEQGREIWKRPEPLVTLNALLPKTERFPAWVVASRYQGPVRILSDGGESIGSFTLNGDTVLDAIEWQEERLVIVRGTALRALDANGRERFQIPFGDFSVMEVAAVRGGTGRPALLAVSGSAPRGVQRWRLALFSPAREIVYDQIFDAPFRLLVAHGATHDTLCLVGNGLRIVRVR